MPTSSSAVGSTSCNDGDATANGGVDQSGVGSGWVGPISTATTWKTPHAPARPLIPCAKRSACERWPFALDPRLCAVAVPGLRHRLRSEPMLLDLFIKEDAVHSECARERVLPWELSKRIKVGDSRRLALRESHVHVHGSSQGGVRTAVCMLLPV